MNILDQDQERRLSALEKGQEEVLKLLRPISETYTTVSTIGKWMMALLVFISIMLGILLSIRTIFKGN